MPVAAPGAQRVAERRDPAQDAMRAGAACRRRQTLRPSSSQLLSPSQHPSPTPVSSSLLLHRRARRRVAPTAADRTRSSLAPAVGKSSRRARHRPTPRRVGRRDWALVTVWGARLAWLAVAVVGGRAVGDAVAGAQRRRAGRRHRRRVGRRGRSARSRSPCRRLATLTAVRAIVPGAARRRRRRRSSPAPTPASTLALGRPGARGDRARRRRPRPGGRTCRPRRTATSSASRCGRRSATSRRAVVTWAVWVAAVVAAAAGRGPPGVGRWPSSATRRGRRRDAGCCPRRWHQLSRRWLVFVPAGLVVHDPVVLAETLMVPRRQIVGRSRLVEVGPDRRRRRRPHRPDARARPSRSRSTEPATVAARAPARRARGAGRSTCIALRRRAQPPRRRARRRRRAARRR